MFSFNFIFSFYFVLAIYTVAFLINKNSFYYFLSFIISEFIGRFAFFSWALDYNYGAFMHLIWALIYSLCVVCFLFSKDDYNAKVNLTVIFTIFLISFQLIMVIDCVWSEGNATFMFDSYKYIIVFIHCCIVLTFVKWGSVIMFMDECIASFWRFIGANGYFLFYQYNIKNIQVKSDTKK